MGLVDYGSGSDSESDSDDGNNVKVELKTAPTVKKQTAPPTQIVGEDSFFEGGIEIDDPSSLNLPSVSAVKTTIGNEDELEDIVKPKDWELKIAEKLRKKQAKKAKKDKKEKKEKKDKKEKKEKLANGEGIPAKPKQKAKIAAFGGLASIASDSDDEESTTANATSLPTAAAQRAGLLSMLPKPKTAGRTSDSATSKAATLLLPTSLRASARNPISDAAPAVVKSAPSVLKRKAVESDDSDDDETTDFFGFSSANEVSKMARMDVGLMPSDGAIDAFGPAKPTAEEAMHPSQMYNMVDMPGTSSDGNEPGASGMLTDEDARRLIFKHEVNPWHDGRSMADVRDEIIDINLTEALGDKQQIQSTLLKNMNRKATAQQLAAPIPKAVNLGDQQARRKHQITYLANLAVAREEALQEKWADSKQVQRQGRQKYGF